MGTSDTDVPDIDSSVKDKSEFKTTAETWVTNHLIDEKMPVRAVISDILDTQRLEVLKAVREQPTTVSELHQQHSISRPTANKYLSEFADLGLVSQQSNKSYEITGGGAIALRIIDDHLVYENRKTLSALSRSSAKPRLLEVYSEITDRSELLEEFDNNFSRSTRATHRQFFEKKGWVTREGGSYHLTSVGKSLKTRYRELERAFEQIIDKAPCLRELGPECEELPVAALADAEQIITKEGSPSLEAMRKYERLIESDFNRCQGLCSYYEPGYARAFASAVKNGKQAEVVGVPKLLRELPFGRPKEWGSIKTQLVSDNYQGYLYLGTLPLGLAIFDDQIAVFGASDPAEIDLSVYGVTGTIFTENDAVIDWATELYKSYERRSISEVEITSPADISGEIRSYIRRFS